MQLLCPLASWCHEQHQPRQLMALELMMLMMICWPLGSRARCGPAAAVPCWWSCAVEVAAAVVVAAVAVVAGRAATTEEEVKVFCLLQPLPTYHLDHSALSASRVQGSPLAVAVAAALAPTETEWWPDQASRRHSTHPPQREVAAGAAASPWPPQNSEDQACS